MLCIQYSESTLDGLRPFLRTQVSINIICMHEGHACIWCVYVCMICIWYVYDMYMMCICMYDMHMIRLEEDDVISRYVHIHILIIYMHEGPCPFLRTQAAKNIFSLMPVKLLRMRLRLIRGLLLPFFVIYIYTYMS